MTAIFSGWERRNPLLCNINTTAVKSQSRMNYLRHYCNLIRKAENRTPPEGYTERHHVFPISIYGKNNRIVILTAREHYIAHCLLEKACIKRYGKNHNKSVRMSHAFWSMNSRKLHINSTLYESSKLRHANNARKSIMGNKHMLGKTHSAEFKEKIGNVHRGRKRSQETRQKMSESAKGKLKDESHKKKISEAIKRHWQIKKDMLKSD